MSESESSPGWSEADSRDFLEFDDCFIPRREEQLRTIVEMLPGAPEEPLEVIELGCGRGLLAARILAARPAGRVRAVDASPTMAAAARTTNAPYGERFSVSVTDLGAVALPEDLDAVVSSLALHHLDHAGKRTLFARIHGALKPGGVVLIADLVEPASGAARRLAAAEWERAVERASEGRGQARALAAFRDDGWNHYALAEPDPIDRPAPIHDQLTWLREAGFPRPDVFWMLAGHTVFGAHKE